MVALYIVLGCVAYIVAGFGVTVVAHRWFLNWHDRHDPIITMLLWSFWPLMVFFAIMEGLSEGGALGSAEDGEEHSDL